MPTLHQWIDLAVLLSLTYFAAFTSMLRQQLSQQKKEAESQRQQTEAERQGWLQVNQDQHQHILACHRQLQAKDELIGSLRQAIQHIKQLHDN